MRAAVVTLGRWARGWRLRRGSRGMAGAPGGGGGGVALAEEVEESGRAPARMSRAELEDLLDDGGVGLRRGTMGPARELVKASVADVLEAVDPFVGWLPWDGNAAGR